MCLYPLPHALLQTEHLEHKPCADRRYCKPETTFFAPKLKRNTEAHNDAYYGHISQNMVPLCIHHTDP